MEERYKLIKASGRDGQIHHAEIDLIFEQDGQEVQNRCGGPLPASVAADSPHDIIIQSALNALGARKMTEIRDQARHKLLEQSQEVEVYYSVEEE